MQDTERDAAGAQGAGEDRDHEARVPAPPVEGARETARSAHTLPVLPRHFVPRARLYARLDQCTRSGVTLVAGPAGAGKTMGIAGWLHARGHDGQSALWIQADSSWSPRRLRAVLDQARSVDLSAGARAGPRLVVIDNAHDLPSGTVRLIDDLLRDAPTSMRLLLASRWDLPLTRLVPELLGHLTVLRGDLLRIDEAEATALVTPHLRKPDAEVVRALVEWAQGWSAVLVLAAHTVGPSPDPAETVRRLAHGSATVADQVATEVFATMTPRQRHVLLCVAGEEPFTAGMAAHLSNDRSAVEVLSELESTGLLVMRVPSPPRPLESGLVDEEHDEADRESRFVVHPLLVEVVRRRLAVDSVDVVRARATVTRAVRLDLAAGHAPQALSRLVRLYAFDEAAAVLAHAGVHMVLGSRHGGEVARLTRAHPEIVNSNASTWFTVALDRWVADDADGIRHWTDRMLGVATVERHLPGSENPDPGSAESGVRCVEVACARLWRGKLALEPMDAAIDYAKGVAAELLGRAEPLGEDASVLAVLMLELGTVQGWLGEHDDAINSLTTALTLSRTQGLSGCTTIVMSHLSLVEFIAGNDRAAAQVATETFVMLSEHSQLRLNFSSARAGLALFLSTAMELTSNYRLSPRHAFPAHLPWGIDAGGFLPSGSQSVAPISSDLSTRFWSRARDALLAAWSGSVASARYVLAAPQDDPRLKDESLPSWLRVVKMLGSSLLAALSADRALLEQLEHELATLGASGEADFVAGLRADAQGQRRSALEAFMRAAETAVCVQPPVRAMSLACAAQLLDSLGEPEDALDRLADAAALTEISGSGVPFLGWSRQGSPIEGLLTRLATFSSSDWVKELAQASAGHADVISSLDPSTPLRGEAREPVDSLVLPGLSSREREVIGELARGATYADIGATLFLSENTVKTHVSSLYTKLGVSRRSEALAVARAHNII